MKMTRNKIRALIVDDEPIARRNIRALLRGYPDVEVVGECGGGAQAVRLIQADPPDLLFLDVQMPEMSGFDVLKQIDLGQVPAVIFVTAYDHYALQAFEAQALDYLLKPFDQDRLHRALERAKTEIMKSAKGALNDNLANLLHSALKPHAENRLIIKSGGRVVFIQLDEIDWIEAAA